MKTNRGLYPASILENKENTKRLRYLKHLFPVFSTLFLLFFSCKEKDEKQYLFLAHTRTLDSLKQSMDPRLEKKDFSKYDLLLLGGDITEETSKKKGTLEYVNRIFNLSSDRTHWALGNHDNADTALVRTFTRKPITYSFHQNGITWAVLYTQEKKDWICTLSGLQLQMLRNITDTIQKSSHLILLMHKAIWLRDNPELKAYTGKGRYDWACNYTITKTNWAQDILPLLRKVQNRGIEVICLAGDFGNNKTTFNVQTSDGIRYLGCGIPVRDEKRSEGRALLFRHHPKTKKLRWEFVPIENLPGG